MVHGSFRQLTDLTIVLIMPWHSLRMSSTVQDKLYILVTSTHGDRKAAFSVDGKRHEFEIPYYTDFFGQWGWEGESEGYLKDASFGFIANHKHSAGKGNDSYSFSYLYKI